MPLSPDLQEVVLGLRGAREKLAPAQTFLSEALKLLESGNGAAATNLLQAAFNYMDETLPILLNTEYTLVPRKSGSPPTHE